MDRSRPGFPVLQVVDDSLNSYPVFRPGFSPEALCSPNSQSCICHSLCLESLLYTSWIGLYSSFKIHWSSITSSKKTLLLTQLCIFSKSQCLQSSQNFLTTINYSFYLQCPAQAGKIFWLLKWLKRTAFFSFENSVSVLECWLDQVTFIALKTDSILIVFVIGKYILFIFGCVGSLLLRKGFLYLECAGFSYWRAWVLGLSALSSCGVWA